MVRELSQLSLLDERDGRFGFRGLASARQIAKLLNDGVRLSEIIHAVSEIRKWLPDAGLSAVRLHAGALSDVRVEQPGGCTDKYGQFVLAVDGARDDPDDLFDRAHAAEQVGDIAEAERLYRLLMKSDPTDASAPFNLGNMLRAAARIVEAEAALRAATRPTTSMQCSIWRCCCCEKGHMPKPLILRRRYLAHDRASEWAMRARRSLKFCEIRGNSVASSAGSHADSDRAA